MIITGIVVVAAAVILMLVAMAGVFGSAVADRERGVFAGFAVYFLCMIGYVVGLALVAIGVAKELF